MTPITKVAVERLLTLLDQEPISITTADDLVYNVLPALARAYAEAMEASEYIHQGHEDPASPCTCVHFKRWRAYHGGNGGPAE